MKLRNILIISGIIISILGIIFHLQGNAVIGPESSFMYSNPEWVSHGIQIVIIGAIICGISIGISIIKKN
jgi:hypothetical protein